MAPKKKTQSNGFMLFSLEWKDKYGKSMNMREVTAITGDLWEKMNMHARQPYNDRAKHDKKSNKHKGEKLACTGTPVSFIVKERKTQEEAERNMKRTIESLVRNSERRDELTTQSYYFIMVNYFIRSEQNVYVPAELAVSEYSLKEGVMRKYHAFVNPDVNVYGHLYEAQQHSECTHLLPLPPKAKGERNLARIYNDVLEFIRPNETDEYPPVFTERESMRPVDSVLDFLKSDMGALDVKLNVFSIQYLFFILKEATCEAGEVQKPKSFYITDALFEADNFEYEAGIACQYHENCDRTKYCALSYVIRWGYTFSDYMCSDIAIPLIPGRHVPKRTNMAAIMPDASSKREQHAAAHNIDNGNANDDNVTYKSGTTNYTSAVAESRTCQDDHRSAISNFTYRTNYDIDERKRTHYNDENAVLERNYRLENTGRHIKNPWATQSNRTTTHEPDDSHFSMNLDDGREGPMSPPRYENSIRHKSRDYN